MSQCTDSAHRLQGETGNGAAVLPGLGDVLH